MNVIGKPRRRVDGRAKVTGQTRFADDVDAAADAALQAAALDACRTRASSRIDVVARAGAPGRPPRAHRQRLPDPVRHPAGEPGRARALPSTACASSAIRSPRSIARDELTAVRGARPHRRRVRAAAHLRRSRGQPRLSRAAHPRLRRRRQHPQGGVAAVRRRRRRRSPTPTTCSRTRSSIEGNTHLPIEQHAAVAAKDPDGKLVAVVEHADAALRAPRAREGAGDAGRAHPRHRDAQRRRLRRQERSVQPRDRRRQGGAAARSAGEDLPDPRGGLLLPSRPPSGADAVQDRRHEGRHDHRHAPADAARRRRLRLVRRRQHLLHRRAADRDLPHPALPLRRLPRLHQQAAVRPQARPRHAAEPLRPGNAARQDRRDARDRSRRPAPAHRRAARHADRELPARRHHRPRRVHPPRDRRGRTGQNTFRQAAARPRRRPRLLVVPLRRRAADLLERHAALRRAAQARSQRRRHGVLRRDRDRPGIRRRAGRRAWRRCSASIRSTSARSPATPISRRSISARTRAASR